ncbi:hypothetical protein Trydic_g11755 [Trypoxylus dichotomus]
MKVHDPLQLDSLVGQSSFDHLLVHRGRQVFYDGLDKAGALQDVRVELYPVCQNIFAIFKLKEAGVGERDVIRFLRIVYCSRIQFCLNTRIYEYLP